GWLRQRGCDITSAQTLCPPSRPMTTRHLKPTRNPQHWAQASLPPLQRFLSACHADFWPDHDGAVANYIPELGKADPAHFGISLATLDGHVYEVGDSRVPF